VENADNLQLPLSHKMRSPLSLCFFGCALAEIEYQGNVFELQTLVKTICNDYAD